MTEKTDIDTLAQRFLDLWQRQLAAMGGDREFAEAMARALELAYDNTRLFAAAAQGGGLTPQEGMPWGATMRGNREARAEEDGTPKKQSSAIRPGQEDRTAPAASAHGVDGGGLDVLARRITVLEERLAALEAGTGGSGKGSRKSPRKRRS